MYTIEVYFGILAILAALLTWAILRADRSGARATRAVEAKQASPQDIENEMRNERNLKLAGASPTPCSPCTAYLSLLLAFR